jgi:hypothetical protein
LFLTNVIYDVGDKQLPYLKKCNQKYIKVVLEKNTHLYYFHYPGTIKAPLGRGNYYISRYITPVNIHTFIEILGTGTVRMERGEQNNIFSYMFYQIGGGFF